MKNQYYELLKKTTINIDKKTYVCKPYKMSLGELLRQFDGKQIYIYEKSLNKDVMRAIII